MTACYEEPVRDHLHIAFAPGAAIIVTAVQEIAPPSSADDNPAVEARLDGARADLAGGWDRWSQGFAALEPIAERTTIERQDGVARRGIHSALVDSFRPVERLLASQGLGVLYDDTGGVRELQIFPAGVGQASRQQRALLDGGLAAWSKQVAAYLDAAVALYAYLDREPDRAVPCLAHVFDDHPETSGPLADHETELVDTLKPTMERVADALLIESGQAYSLNELSRLVFDTFQGRLTVAPDGPVLEAEGFVEHEDCLERPPVDLWRALESMAGGWLAPELVTAMVTPGPPSAQPDPDPVSFATLPRRWAPAPDAATVESELRARLRPEPLYRVTWQTLPRPESDETELGVALDMLTNAERDVPD
jgi:hypothetical protein